MHSGNRARPAVWSFVVAILLVTAASAAWAEMKVPSTPEDYLARAKQYREKAEGYRKEAQEHRDMAEAARKNPLNAQTVRGQRDPSVEKMVKHCNGIAAKADALALENEKAADFYELRGKELKELKGK